MLKGKLTEINVLASPAPAGIQAVCHSSCDHNAHVLEGREGYSLTWLQINNS